MNNNRLKIYAIIISAVSAALLVAVIIMAVMLSAFAGYAEKEAEKIEAEVRESETVQESIWEPEDNSEEVTEKKDDDKTEETSDEGSESYPDNPFNVSSYVEWEAGNDDMQNVIIAWGTMLKQMDFDADLVFMGDSITVRGDFRPYFPDKKIINLGCGGDTIRGVYNRAGMLSYANAEKIFIMCGVNMLRNDNVDFCRTEYGGLLNAVEEYAPDAQVYVCSILPMAQDWQDEYCAHETTEQFNLIIKELAENRGMTYVDLYPLFEKDGVMNPEYTIDGVHLNRAGYDLWMESIYGYVYD